MYAIGFGAAFEMLVLARLYAPPEIESESSVYWYGNCGYSGGNTENAFAGIGSTFRRAFTLPSSGGGSGGFGGGGGGGAW